MTETPKDTPRVSVDVVEHAAFVNSVSDFWLNTQSISERLLNNAKEKDGKPLEVLELCLDLLRETTRVRTNAILFYTSLSRGLSDDQK